MVLLHRPLLQHEQPGRPPDHVDPRTNLGAVLPSPWEQSRSDCTREFVHSDGDLVSCCKPYLAESLVLVLCSRRRSAVQQIPQPRRSSSGCASPRALCQLRDRDHLGLAIFGKLYGFQQHGHGLHRPPLRFLLHPGHLPFDQRPQQYPTWSLLAGSLWSVRQRRVAAVDLLHNHHVLVPARQTGHRGK